MCVFSVESTCSILLRPSNTVWAQISPSSQIKTHLVVTLIMTFYVSLCVNSIRACVWLYLWVGVCFSFAGISCFFPSLFHRIQLRIQVKTSDVLFLIEFSRLRVFHALFLGLKHAWKCFVYFDPLSLFLSTLFKDMNGRFWLPYCPWFVFWLLKLFSSSVSVLVTVSSLANHQSKKQP